VVEEGTEVQLTVKSEPSVNEKMGPTVYSQTLGMSHMITEKTVRPTSAAIGHHSMLYLR